MHTKEKDKVGVDYFVFSNQRAVEIYLVTVEVAFILIEVLGRNRLHIFLVVAVKNV